MTTGDALYLVDGTYNVFRAYHARGVPEMRARDGTPTKATYIFTRMLLSVLDGRKPRYLGVAFDLEGPTLRHGEYDGYVEKHPEAAAEMRGYKATRPETPPELLEQMPWCKRICEAFGVPLLELPGYEADDIIGALAVQARRQSVPVVIVTADKDLFQLVGNGIVILNPHKENLIMDSGVVEREFGVRPEQVPDVLALMGDVSDNIPGVPGIGEKGAKELIRQMGSLDEVLARAGEIPRKTYRESLLQNVERARLSRELARIRTDAPVTLDLDSLEISEPDKSSLREIFTKLEFHSLKEKYISGAAPAAPGPEIEMVANSFRALTAAEEIRAFVEGAKEAGEISLKLETTPASPMDAQLVGLALSVREHEAIYVPLAHSYLGAPRQPSWDEIRVLLEPALADASVRKVGHNLKHILTVLARIGARVEGLSFDTMLAAYLLDPSRRTYSLSSLARDFLGEEPESTPAQAAREGELAGRPVEEAAARCGADAELALRLQRAFLRGLQAEKLVTLFEEIEMPLLEVLSDMERAGVRIDSEYLQEFSKELMKEAERISQEAFEIAGHPFNLDSPVQLRRVLFEEIGLKPLGRTALTRAYSTKDEDLEALATLHALPARIRDYRAVAKLRSTYADALPKLVNARTGRVHTSFNQTGAASGRLSSSDPNLQNVPIRTELGRKVRRAFIPEPGWKLVCADYSQIELRIMAHMSCDSDLQEAFERGEDIHRRTAAEIFGISYELVSEDQRRAAKTVNFGVIYGMGDFRLSNDLGIPRAEAKRFIDAYFSRYSSVRRYIDETITQVASHGEVRTLFGRLRRFPEVKSSNFNARQQAIRAAVNTTIQGTAADIIKKAMISLHRRLKDENLGARMLIQVHDELVLEAPAEESSLVRRIVKEEMESAHPLRVPLVADVKEGNNWLEAK